MNQPGHLYIRDFARRHDLSTIQLADLLAVEPSTVRRYKAAPTAHMHRALNPVARRLLEWYDAHPDALALPIARAKPRWSNADFAAACAGLANSASGAALGVARQTVYRWERDLPVPATAAKLASLYQVFGWP